MEPFKCDLCQGNGARDKSLENEMTLEIELLNDENDKLFKQVIDLKFWHKTLINGHRLCGSIVSRAINCTMNGLGYPSPKLVEASKNRPKRPKIKFCVECWQHGHFGFECKTQPLPKLSTQLRPIAAKAPYLLSKISNGQIIARFCGAKDKTRPEQIWVPSH